MPPEEAEKPKYKTERWSQLISIGRTTASQINLVLLKEALEENEADPLLALKAKKKPWEMFFDPELLVEEHK